MSTMYAELASEMARSIEAGIYQPGEKLPGIRRTSLNKKVSAATAVSAYRQLEIEGYIESRPRSGFYVSVRSQRQMQEPDFHATDIGKPELVEGQEQVLQLARQMDLPGVIKLGAAVPDPSYLPTRAMEMNLKAVAGHYRNTICTYDTPQGIKPLRQQLAKRMAQIGCMTPMGDIQITSGCQEAVFLSLKSLTRAGDIVALESPNYHGHLQILDALQLKALEIPTDPKAGISLEALQLAMEQWPIKACVLIPNFSNPLGVCLSEEKKRRLVALGEHFKVPLIEDDIYGDLSFAHSRPPPLKSFDHSGNVIYCSSFSKTLAPGLRVGWVVSARYQQHIEYQKFIANVSNGSLSQLAVARFLDSGKYDKHLRFIRSELAKTCARISAAVSHYFPRETRITKPSGGYVIWVELPPQVNSLKVAERALQKKISVAPGPLFSATPRYLNFMRLSCGVAWSAQIEKAIATLGEIVSELAVEEVREKN